MADATKTTTSYSTDPALYMYTSLTAGSSHIVTATSRLETILRANRVPFKAIDIAVDEKARMLWGRRAGKDANGRMRKLPGLVQMGLVLGDLVEIEEWNEYGEVRQHVTIYHDDFTIPTKAEAEKLPNKLGGTRSMLPTATAAKPAESSIPSTAGAAAQPPAAPPLPENTKPAATSSSSSEGPKKSAASAVASATAPIRSVAEEAAQKAKQLRLESLREKVYGGKKDSGDAATTKDAKEDAAATTAEDKDKATSTTTAASTKEEGAPAPAVSVDSAAAGVSELTISPMARRRSEDDGGAEGVKQHGGSTVADAPAEEIEAVEEAQVIPEAPEEEDGKTEGAKK
ncbi:hypothetical protein DL764_010842 [Monosporascus ibericus]|uniref:Glutaredoxin domain-containing protein n=1 Tax=Monosporascus ibericus TaxID=155417 RepID=A0A4Q4SS05_9PEZI|nr:hypothetical protein DL764_010842 [Monosporascus ibericus]